MGQSRQAKTNEGGGITSKAPPSSEILGLCALRSHQKTILWCTYCIPHTGPGLSMHNLLYWIPRSLNFTPWTLEPYK